MEETKEIINWGQVLSYSIIVLLTAECIFLILQNKDLKQTLNSTSSVAQVEPLKPGDKVESFKTTSLDGNIGELNYNDPTKKYLLFVLSTTCPHCEKTLPVWESITDRNDDRCYIIGVSLHNLDDTRKFAESKKVGFYIVSAMSDTSFTQKYKISGVPETILAGC